MRKKFTVSSVLLVSIVFLYAVCACSFESSENEKVSRFGEYSGYSEMKYDGVERSSFYVAVSDGTKLAVDLFRPSSNGKVEEKPLPLIWTFHRYHRAIKRGDRTVTVVDSFSWPSDFIKHGYTVAAVDIRGSGASFGSLKGVFTHEEAQDLYDLNEWFGRQSWCDGTIGMFGRSYLAITQLMAAGMHSPHLKAIFPQYAVFDMYEILYPGGVYRDDFIKNWGTLTRNMQAIWPVLAVDSDASGEMLNQAIAGQKNNTDVTELYSSMPFRDSRYEPAKGEIYREWNPLNYLEGINTSGVAVYHLGGWFDCFTRDTLLWFANIKTPQKVMMGSWHHLGRYPDLALVEHLRWFDYWLKGIENGVMDEEPIHYATYGTDGWNAATQWPLPGQKLVSFYFHGGPSNSIDSANDGLLSPEIPVTGGTDTYTIDYSTSTGTNTRWDVASGGSNTFEYPDMADNDSKGLTYTTEPLSSDTLVTGHPVVTLHLSSTSKDVQLFAYLEEVDEDGTSHYITEGILKASHREIIKPEYNMLGLPYHASTTSSASSMPVDQPVKLEFDLHPTSNLFDKGHRIRVTITCADKDNYDQNSTNPTPGITLYRMINRPSHIDLPTIGNK